MTGSPRPEARDLLRLVAVDDPRIAPAGDRVAWLETRIVPAENRTVTRLRVGAADAAADPTREAVNRPSAQDVAEAEGLRHARWNAQGDAIAWIAPGRRGSPSVWIDRFDGAGPVRLADPGGTPLGFAWDPSGRGLAVVVRRVLEPRATPAPPGVVHTARLRWKWDGVGYLAGPTGDRWDALTWLPSDGTAARELAAGAFDVAAPAFAPDGRTLACLVTIEPESAGAAGRRRCVALIEAFDPDAIEPLRDLVSLADVRIPELAWSPDGRTLALAGHDAQELGHYGAQRVWTVDVATGAAHAWSVPADGTVGNASYTDVGGGGGTVGPQWVAGDEGFALVAPLSRSATVRLWRFEDRQRTVPLTPDDRVVAAFSVDRAGRRAAVLAYGSGGPGEIYVVDLSPSDAGGKARGPLRLTLAGEALARAVPGVPRRRLRVPATEDGDPEIDAWVVLPPGSESGPPSSVPLVLYCGGGPGGMRSDNYFFEFELYARRGFGVLWLNARGCQGYDDPFCTAILGDWGGADWRDERRALDHVLAEIPQVDRDRLGIAGGSYGGFQVTWAIGDTNRFRAAVADRSVVDKLGTFGSSDMGYLRAFEYGDAAPWEAPERYLRQSPLMRIGGARTPTLVIHSAFDLRCPVDQGERLFAALAIQGVPCELLRFPDESHGLSRGGRPWHRVKRIEAYLDWFERWLEPATAGG